MRKEPIKIGDLLKKYNLLVLLIVFVIISSILSPNFLTLGNLLNLYGIPVTVGEVPGMVLLFLFGSAVGIFVGCLVMSLAETLNALPVIARRIRLAIGLQFVILAVALGKLAGSLYYFWKGVGNG